MSNFILEKIINIGKELLVVKKGARAHIDQACWQIVWDMKEVRNGQVWVNIKTVGQRRAADRTNKIQEPECNTGCL